MVGCKPGSVNSAGGIAGWCDSYDVVVGTKFPQNHLFVSYFIIGSK